MSNQMTVDGHTIELHFPLRDNRRGQGLAPVCSWPAYDASLYPEQIPPEWLELASPIRKIYFFGVPPLLEREVDGETVQEGDRELWFNFHMLNHGSHEYAILILVQGLNAVTGLPTDEGMVSGEYRAPGKAVLEQYNKNCPAHGTPLGADRFCSECGFNWPKQNYITNAAGPSSVSQFWRDGWRKGDGKIYQFAIRPTEAGVGVAQQILKACRTLAIDIVVFRSKQPKPAPAPRPAWRGGGFLGGGGQFETFGGGTAKGIGSSMGGDYDLGLESCDDAYESTSPKPMFMGPEPTRDGGSLHSESASRRFTPAPRPAALERMEVAAGREVDQKIYPDPHDMEYWETDPCAMFTIVPVNQDWATQVTTGGPTKQTTPGGAFSGIQTV